MRCTNCGWPNKPNETRCTKCGAPLVSNQYSSIRDPFTDSSQIDSSELKKTVLESEVFDRRDITPRPNSTQNEEAKTEDTVKICPKCGYPLRTGADKCPNCQTQISGSPQSSYRGNNNGKGNDYTPQATRIDMVSGNHNGTVNPYLDPINLEKKTSFILKPVKRSDERHDLNEIEFEGKSISLNRENTDANNPSITSHEQAIISNVEGHWYIEDKSKQRTTFVQAATRIEINDGDLILLGNRIFEFHI